VSVPRLLKLDDRGLRRPRAPCHKPARAVPDDGLGRVLNPLPVVPEMHRRRHAGQGTTGPIVLYDSRSLVLKREQRRLQQVFVPTRAPGLPLVAMLRAQGDCRSLVGAGIQHEDSSGVPHAAPLRHDGLRPRGRLHDAPAPMDARPRDASPRGLPTSRASTLHNTWVNRRKDRAALRRCTLRPSWPSS
jgi:hypothetical protein